MKKISILMALILCITISGVYAAWAYTGNTVGSVDRTISHGLTTSTTDGDVGILRVIENTVDVAIDQTAEGNYLAKLVITGQITVEFTPNPGAPDEVLEHAVPVQATLYTKNASANLYDGKEIYVSPTGASVNLIWERQDNGTFRATVNAGDIDNLLDLGGDFVLSTLAKYNTFHELEENITLTVQFSMQ